MEITICAFKLGRILALDKKDFKIYNSYTISMVIDTKSPVRAGNSYKTSKERDYLHSWPPERAVNTALFGYTKIDLCRSIVI